MGLREAWDRFVWLIPFVVVVTLVLLTLFGREPFCGSGQENCFREWVSALSGWFAGVAAFITLAVLSRQISDGRKHHQQALDVTLLRTDSVVNRARSHAHDLLASVASTEFILRQSPLTQARVDFASAIVMNVQGKAMVSVFDQFADEVGSASPSLLSEARSSLETAVMSLKVGKTDPEVLDACDELIGNALNRAREFANDIIATSEAFKAWREHLAN
ncbi:hypothetical protein [Ensifer sp. BR816]|uniref:hypothetical protein n=1 Tax=Rhizobium sp. (strain BR816) TaxID=1057002 RepID=UPI0003756430|nr:hypothetical protein [Ensifer sp. BR816]